jgi:ABC-type sugar transport system permease subunit
MAREISFAGAATGTAKIKSGRIPPFVPYLFLIPALVILFLFRYIPAFSAIFFSFTDWDGVRVSNFVGLQQYQALFQDPVFLQSLRNIFIYTAVRTVVTTVMALVGAELLYNLRSFGARAVWRIVFTVPLVIPLTVIFLIWRRIYAGQLGLINEALRAFGLGNLVQPWLGQPSTALPALSLIGFPFVAGFGFLVLLAALQDLPSEVNEAALLDGCTRLRRVFAIDIPAITGQLALLAILSINAGLQEFAPMLIITSGGPVNATQSPGLYLYQQAVTYAKYGYSTAIGTVLMMMTLVFSIAILYSRYRRATDVTV